MKTLKKIQINPDRLMKNDDLLSIKGGYDGCDCKCYTWEGQFVQRIEWAGPLDCNPLCLIAIEHGYGDC